MTGRYVIYDNLGERHASTGAFSAALDMIADATVGKAHVTNRRFEALSDPSPHPGSPAESIVRYYYSDNQGRHADDWAIVDSYAEEVTCG